MLSKKKINEVYYELAALRDSSACVNLLSEGKEELAGKLWGTLQQLLFYAFLNEAGLEVSYKNIANFLVKIQPALNYPDALQDALNQSLETLLLTYAITSGLTFPDIETANDYYNHVDFTFFDKPIEQVKNDIKEITEKYKDLDQAQQIELFIKKNKPITDYVNRFGFN